MDEQMTCWNDGDLECFMQHYWKSDSLMFIGKSGVTYGWQGTLNNYIKSYPDRGSMGKLTFTIIDIEQLSDDKTYVIGKWHLQRKDDAPEGHYTLLWKLIGENWVIVSDHSS
jgi:ketosteroid isomerase-like protein